MQYYWLLRDLHCSKVLSFVELWIQEFLNGVIFHLSSNNGVIFLRNFMVFGSKFGYF